MMHEFIANNIINAKKAGGVEAGRKKYNAYFSGFALRLYKNYKSGVDLILTTHVDEETGMTFEDCIVE